jgi:hypothetical protein
MSPNNPEVRIADKWTGNDLYAQKTTAGARAGIFQPLTGHKRHPNEIMQMEPMPMRLCATPDAITWLEQTFDWMQWIEVETRCQSALDNHLLGVGL